MHGQCGLAAGLRNAVLRRNADEAAHSLDWRRAAQGAGSDQRNLKTQAGVFRGLRAIIEFFAARTVASPSFLADSETMFGPAPIVRF